MLDAMRRHAQSWGIKIAFGVIILVFVFYFGAGNLTKNRESVVAYVNDEPISAQTFIRSYEQGLEAVRRQNPGLSADDLQKAQFKKTVLAQMVNSKLVENWANQVGLALSPAELRFAIGNLPAFQNEQRAFDPALYRAALASSGQTPGQFESGFGQSIRNQQLETYLTLPARATEAQARDVFNYVNEKIRIDYIVCGSDEFMDKVQITDKDIADYYQANQAGFVQPARIKIQYALITPKDLGRYQTVQDQEIKDYFEAHADKFRQEEQVKARHILVKVAEDAPEAEVKQAEARIKKIQARLQMGDKFEETARKESQGPNADQGGELGWLGRGQTVKTFEDALFALAKGEVSQPVRTKFGFHLIQAEDRREAGLMGLDQVRDTIRELLAQERASEQINKLLDRAVDQLSAQVPLPKVLEDLNLPSKTSEFFTKDTIQQAFGMTKEAAETLFALPLNKSPDMPLAVEGGYILAQKVEENPEALASLEAMRPTIQTFLKKAGALKQAQAKAADALAKLSDPKTAETALKDLRKDLKTSDPFNRQGFIPNLGTNLKLATDAFNAKGKNWLGQTYETGTGFVLARLAERIPAPESDWNRDKESWLNLVENRQAQELFQAFIRQLSAQAKVEVVRPDMLD